MTAGIFSVWIEQETIARAIAPGQFLNVRVAEGHDPLLRRPLSVSDIRGDRLRLIYRVVGRGTRLLTRLRSGDMLDVLGPLGRPAAMPAGRDIVLVGGGIGAAPLLFLSRRLKRSRCAVRAFLGARCRSQLILLPEFRNACAAMEVATDDGSRGFPGFVTELVERRIGARKHTQAPIVFACGPKAMLADLVHRLAPLPVWGFVEERMGCGTGICYCCALPRKGGGHVRFCEEGPVVLLNEVAL